MRSPALVGLPISPYDLSFFIDCFHMTDGVSHLGRLPAQPCQVTPLGGIRFLHVNAEGGVGWCLAGHLSISLNITLKPATILVSFSAEFTFKTSKAIVSLKKIP